MGLLMGLRLACHLQLITFMYRPTESSTLVVFCRRPAPGVGKQRIAAELGQQAGWEVGELLLATALEDARSWPGSVVLAPAATADSEWATTLLQNARVVAQPPGNLGQRIQTIHRYLRANGSSRIIIIGTDAPSLTSKCLNEAAASLADYDTVIVPARDGGVTLLGTRLQWPELSSLPWETPQLGQALTRLCEDAGHQLHIMPVGSDVDTRQDLLSAYALLKADPRPARIALCNWIARSGLLDAGESTGTEISAIVPVFNDIEALRQLLHRLAAMEPNISEIVVADGSDSPGCEQLCKDYGAIYLRTEANRGKQLRQGAAVATKDIFWFLHADSNPPVDAAQIIREHLQMRSGSGYFRFKFDGPPTWYKKLLEQAINFRARIGTPYGDQGLFIRKEAYLAAGGHAASPLFEEVKLVKNLRAAVGCTPVRATLGVSPRRWERDGWLRRSLHNRGLALAFMLGVAPERLARHYAGVKHGKENTTSHND